MLGCFRLQVFSHNRISARGRYFTLQSLPPAVLFVTAADSIREIKRFLKNICSETSTVPGPQARASVWGREGEREEESRSAGTMSPFTWWGRGVEKAGLGVGGGGCSNDGAASRPLRRGRSTRDAGALRTVSPAVAGRGEPEPSRTLAPFSH